MLFTDGVDTTSRRADYESNIMDAQELDALIYPVQYDTSRDMNAAELSTDAIDMFGQILGGIFGGGRREAPRWVPRWGEDGAGRDDYEFANRYLMELANSTGGREYPRRLAAKHVFMRLRTSLRS